jgi:hypothetical protein
VTFCNQSLRFHAIINALQATTSKSTLRKGLTNALFVLPIRSQMEEESWWTATSTNGKMLERVRQIFKLRHLLLQTATNSIVIHSYIQLRSVGFTWIQEGCLPCSSNYDGSTFQCGEASARNTSVAFETIIKAELVKPGKIEFLYRKDTVKEKDGFISGRFSFYIN